MMHQNGFDKWLMRGKDAIVIFSALGCCFLFLFKYYSLPGEVAAQGEEIRAGQVRISELHDASMRFDTRLSKIEVSQEYTNKGVDRIEGWLKRLSSRIPQ